MKTEPLSVSVRPLPDVWGSIFRTDNGFHLGEHRLLMGKGTPYEEAIRVPLIVRGPGMSAGETHTQVVGTVDLAPTLADWAQRPFLGSDIDGRSLAPLLVAQTTTPTWRTAILFENPPKPATPVASSAQASINQAADDDNDVRYMAELAAAGRASDPSQVVSRAVALQEEVNAVANVGLRTHTLNYVEYKTSERSIEWLSTKGGSMIIRNSHYMIFSQSSNSHYWEQDRFPEWTRFVTIRHFPDQRIGTGVEPHYHDCDESWLFSAGAGEVWLDDERFAITPNTLVYTPMGVVHHFQMYTNGENNAFVTRLERQKRPIHILVEQDGPPEKTAPGFVIAGALNNEPILNPSPRCPFSELRMVTFAAGEEITQGQLPANEHWLVCDGVLHLELDKRKIELYKGDLALLRAGVVRRLWTNQGVRVVLVRERVQA